MKKIFFSLALAVSILLCGCSSEAEKANYNISKQADYFESERKITVYNARTDKVIMEAEGYMSISNNSNNELVCTVKVGPDSYRKNYLPERLHHVCGGGHHRHPYRPVPLQALFPHRHPAQCGDQTVKGIHKNALF